MVRRNLFLLLSQKICLIQLFKKLRGVANVTSGVQRSLRSNHKNAIWPIAMSSILHRSHRLLENKFLGNKTNMYPSENCM